MKMPNDKAPNFRDKEGKLFLIRCYNCEPNFGTENYAPVVSKGVCAWCGWKEEKDLDKECNALDKKWLYWEKYEDFNTVNITTCRMW